MIDQTGKSKLNLHELCVLIGVDDPQDWTGYVVVLMPSEIGMLNGQIPTMSADTANVGNIIYALGYVLGGLGEGLAMGQIGPDQIGPGAAFPDDLDEP